MRSPPGLLPEMNIKQNTVVTADLSGKRDYMTSECKLTNGGRKFLSFPSLKSFDESVMPPNGWGLL